MEPPPFDITGRTVIVTGGLGQLGLQFSRALISAGARVACFDLRRDLEPFEKRFGWKPGPDELLPLEVDVTERASLVAGLERVLTHWGVPHGLINNAGIDSPPGAPAGETGPFEGYPEASWERVMAVNTKGVFLCCQVIGESMARERRGSIVNISSIYGMVSPDQRIYSLDSGRSEPFFKPVAYSASKGAVLNLTRYLATYWAPRGVRVNTLTCGGVFNDQDSVFLERYTARVPLARMAREDEYNGAIQFLLSDAASYMTGANLVLDGGWTSW